MYKNIIALSLILSIVLLIILFFYKIDLYSNGEKFIDNSGKTYLIFENTNFYNKIYLKINNETLSVNISNIYKINNFKIYEIEEISFDIKNVLAIKRSVSLFEYVLINFHK